MPLFVCTRNKILRKGPTPMRCWRGVALWMAVVLIAGCQSGNYRAGRLPQKYRAPELSQNKTIDFASVAMPGSSSAMIAPADLLEITVATGRENEQAKPIAVRVAEDGTVDVPIIGPVPVAGMEASDASKQITNSAVQRGMYRHPIITVEIKSKAINRVTVLGAVKEPGMYELPRGGSDLVSAIAASGGLTEEAGTEIEIIRQPSGNPTAATAGGVNAHGQSGNIQASFDAPDLSATSQPPGWLAPQSVRIDLADSQARNNVDYRLYDRDFVRVVARKKEVIHVAGLVTKPGQFELPLEHDIHLLDAIALAGGQSSSVADKVFVIRRFEDKSQPIVIQASIAKAKQNGLENLKLQAGDTVSVEQTPATVVLDSISKFFRLSFGVASNTVF